MTTPPATIEDRLRDRGVSRLRHFTTNAGLTGILATGEIRSRDLLEADNYLDRIYLPNCEIRFDPEWTGHVSVSVTDINSSFFAICSGASSPRWHSDMDGFWAIFEIDPVVATHDGVYFTTTNNRYSNVSRQSGAPGLEAMFADVVHPFRPTHQYRPLIRNSLADNQPTDAQAEILYPGAIPVEHVSAILVATEEDAHSTISQLGYFRARRSDLSHIETRIDPAAFLNRVPGGSTQSPGHVGTGG